MRSVLKKIRRILRPQKYGFRGSYSTWQEAMAHSRGYDSPAILEKVKDSLLKVKRGEAAYERDSITFDKVQYSWPVLTGLLIVASRNGNRLNVLDFGGSLGSSYFQNRGMLAHLAELKWNVVEQKNFVQAGKENFEDSQLKFFESIEDAAKSGTSNVFLASSSLQYLEKPYEFMEGVAQHGFEYIIIDRTPCLPENDRITVQKIHPRIYDASYPAWVLNEKRLTGILAKSYEEIGSWSAPFGDIALRGFIFKKR